MAIKFINRIWVQIVNDRSTRGKCYGFVTFGNPRSAVDAINDMNGRVCIFSVTLFKTSCKYLVFSFWFSWFVGL